MSVAVIATVLNERESISRLLDSLIAQSTPPDEVVIVDGGSRDDTIAILYRYEDRLPLRVILAPDSGISAGRNIAIRAAYSDLIAVTDAGVILDPHWLENITRPLRDDATLHTVAGFFRADPHTVFEAAMGATVLPLVDEIDPDTFLPSSRSVAFRKSAWQAAGRYPEWLDYCEDLIFDLRLIETSGAFTFAPDAVAYFRPRSSLLAFFKQYRLYARGDGKANLWGKRHAVRYATYLIALPLIGWLGRRVHPVFYGLYALGAAVYLRVPYRRLPIVLGEAERLRVTPQDAVYAAALIPIICVVGDVAKMIGYPAGWWWRHGRPADNRTDVHKS